MQSTVFLPLDDTRNPASSTLEVLRERIPSLSQPETLHFAPLETIPIFIFSKYPDKNQLYAFCWFINSNYFFRLMGGSKNKSPAQKEKTQKKGAEEKKTSKSPKEKRAYTDTVNINESQAEKYIKNSQVITVHGLARETNVKISIANAYIKKSVQNGILKRTSGFSGHHIYQPVSK